MASKKDQETLSDLIDKFNASLEHPAWENFSKNAPKDFRYKEGEQWTSDEIKEIEDRGQAPTVENEITPILDRLMGKHRSQKSRTIFRGRNLGVDEEKANILTDLALHTHQMSDYEFEEADIFDNANTCGFGCLEVKITFNDALQPQVIKESTEPLDMFPDPQSKAYDWNKDADFITRAKWMPLKKAQALYPKYKKQLASLVTTEQSDMWSEREDVKKDNYVDANNKRIRIMETWWKKYKTKRMAFTDDGVKDVTKDKSYKDDDVQVQVMPEMQKSIWAFNVLIENKPSPYDHNFFPFVPYFVYRRKDGEPYSKTRQIIDPQDEINKRRSKALHLLNTNQAVYEEGAVHDEDTLKKEMAKPDGLIKYRRGFQFEIQKNIEVVTTQMQFHQEAKAAIPRIAGVSDEALGRHSEIRSGIGLQRKQLMTEIMSNPIFDNLRRTRKLGGRLEYELYKQYYTDEKTFLVTDELGQDREVKLDKEGIEQIKEGIYDIIVEDAPDTTTIQDEQFQMLSNVVQGMGLPPQISLRLTQMLFKVSQLKGKDEIVDLIQGMVDAPPTESPKMNLTLAWQNLTKVEKAVFAQMMGQPELAKAEMEQGVDGDPDKPEPEGGEVDAV